MNLFALNKQRIGISVLKHGSHKTHFHSIKPKSTGPYLKKAQVAPHRVQAVRNGGEASPSSISTITPLTSNPNHRNGVGGSGKRSSLRSHLQDPISPSDQRRRQDGHPFVTWHHICSISPLHLPDSDLIPRCQTPSSQGIKKCPGIKRWAQFKDKELCANIIDQILTSSLNFDLQIHSFTLSRFFLPHIGNDTLIRWFEIITQGGIRRLVLQNNGYPLYPIPFCSLINSQTLIELKVKFCVLPLYSFSFPRLRVLDLEETRLSDECLEGILSKSPVLESLKMAGCRGLKRIRICSESMRIFNLETSYLFRIEEIVIESAPSLEEIVLNKHASEVILVKVLHAPMLNPAQATLQRLHEGT